MWEFVKSAFISISTAIIAYLDPVAGNIKSLMMLFLLNFLVGFVTGYIKNNESFNIHKFMVCFIWGTAILATICCIYYIGENLGSRNETLEILRWISLTACWAFFTNILRNFKILSKGAEPYYKFFDALYYFVSIEFIKKVPFLTKYNIKKNGSNENQQ